MTTRCQPMKTIKKDIVPVVEITDPELKAFVSLCLERHPTYEKVPSSRGGKRHPKDEYVPYGNSLHIFRVVRILEDLIRDDEGKAEHRKHTPLTQDEKDVLRAAAIIHDLNKASNTGRVSAGPNMAANLLREVYGRGWHSQKPWALPLVELVAVHGGAFYPDAKVGRWTFVYNPENKLHRLLHTADYIASRTYIHTDVDNLVIEKKNWVPRWKWFFMRWYMKRLRD